VELNYELWMCVSDGEGLRLLLSRLMRTVPRQGGTDRVDAMKAGLREVSRLEWMDDPIYRKNEQGETHQEVTR
jgi:hypothetical protein